MVESQPSKLLVAGSIPVSRSSLIFCRSSRLTALREQGTIPVNDPENYGAVHRH